MRVSEGQTTRSDERQSELQPPVTFGQFQLTLPNFEGPLDLLLHLIREHKLDIFDIPIALVTEKYLEYLARIKEINLDIAGEFLVMASTLAHIKSRLLLPRPQIQGEAEAEEEVDPRAELVRRLLEYQKYRDVAETLAKRSLLGREVFCRTAVEVVAPADGDLGLVEVSVYQLIETLDRVLKNATPQVQHEVIRDRLSVSDAIHDVAERLRANGKVSFFSLFAGQRQHQKIIVTFLAALEMCRLKLIQIFQDESGEIVLAPRGEALTNAIGAEVDENEYR
jgi:segregation and condensation protein A